MLNPDCNELIKVRQGVNQEISQAVNQVLQADWLKIHIRSRIHALKLSSLISEEDIIQYVVECLTEAINSGTTINYPVAWSKLVSERRIQKLYNKNKFSQATESEKIEYLASSRCDENSFYNNNDEINKKIQQLKPASRKIIRMRFFEDLSWDKIADVLSEQEGKRIRVATARKRGERALNELRQIYFQKLVD
ncbi:MAG: sigma-70 family RNA polymerase sigma factor [Cyanobacteria bacterium J06621_15]